MNFPTVFLEKMTIWLYIMWLFQEGARPRAALIQKEKRKKYAFSREEKHSCFFRFSVLFILQPIEKEGAACGDRHENRSGW